MLRTCNDLLRRLSKASATVLCGRILILLAHFFQLSERSALNLSSRTNTHDTAVEEEEEEEQASAAVDATMEDSEEQGQAIDREFHQQFWSLQAMFQVSTSSMML
jgi:THO complex subunit 1